MSASSASARRSHGEAVRVDTVVDLGCADHGGAYSLPALVEHYEPARLFGFDPWPLLDERVTMVAGVPCILRRTAAWVYDGEVQYLMAATSSSVGAGPWTVPCFDFSEWLLEIGPDAVAVKMDIEGAEYELLAHLIRNGTDSLISELLIEWHGGRAEEREALLAELDCPVREWWI